jgi:dTMP kinase
VTGSSTAVGGILVLRLLPSLVSGPIVTRLVGRWSRRRTMLAMDLLRAVVVALIPVLDDLWWIYLWAFVLEVAGLVFLPARDASIPDLVEPEDLSLANGLVLASSYATIPLGAALFGLAGTVVGGRAGISLAFAIDAGTFLASYVLIRGITGLDTARPIGGEATTFSAAFRIPLVRAFAPAILVATLGLGALFSIGIVFVRDVLGASTAQFGALIALFGVGAAAGLGMLRTLSPDSLSAVRYGLLAQGTVIATMSLAPTLALVFVGAALFGAATSVTVTAAMSALQELLADRDRVAGFAAFHVLIRIGLCVSAIGAGIAADVVSGVRWPGLGALPPARIVLLGAGVTVLVGAALIVPRLRPERFGGLDPGFGLGRRAGG